MKVFLINLDSDIDRLNVADAQLCRLDVYYERFPAVYAKAMQSAEKNKKVNRFRWWCANGRKILDGELGCALSHMGIYRKMLAEGIEKACILEDDVVIDNRFPMVLANLEKQYDPNTPHVVLLSNHMEPPKGQVGDPFVGYLTEPGLNDFRVEFCGWDTFAEGYVIGTAAAKAILSQNDPIIAPCDSWCRWQDNGAIKLYRAYPTVCCQNKYGFESNMLSDAFLSKDLPTLKRFWYKVQRFIGLKIDQMLRRVTGR